MPPIAAAKLYIQDAPKNEARNSWPQFCQILTDLLLVVVNRLFSDIDIVQGSVATYARNGGIFDEHFTANLPGNFLVKTFCKSAEI